MIALSNMPANSIDNSAGDGGLLFFSWVREGREKDQREQEEGGEREEKRKRGKF